VGLIKVTSEELQQQGARTTTAATNVQDTLSVLRGQINDLSSRWEGAASTSFQALYDEWQQGAAHVQQSLEGIAKFLNQAATTYEQAEQQIRQSSGH
jgi:early secretory antigenic target protein ESAT-6